MKALEDAAMLTKMLEWDRVFEFLARLNPNFDGVRGWMVGKEPFPSLDEIFSYVTD